MIYSVYFANAGVPATGLTLTWESFLKVSDGADPGDAPAFTETGGGWYKFTYAPSEDIVAVVDGSATLGDADRYVPVSLSPQDDRLADPIYSTVWDRILSGATHNIPSSAGRRLRQFGDVVSSSVNDSSPTDESFGTNLTNVVDTFYNDQLIRFTSGNLAGSVRVVLDYDGTNKTLTVSEPWTEAPADGDEFDILPSHEHPTSQVADAVWDALSIGHTDVGKAGYQLWTALDAFVSKLDSDTTGLNIIRMRGVEVKDSLSDDSTGLHAIYTLAKDLHMYKFNKVTLTRNSATSYTLTMYADDGTTVQRTISITKEGSVETREGT